MKHIINYSGIPVLILIPALVFMLVSCSKEAVQDNPLVNNSSQLIKISGEDANAATKTILVNLATLWLGGSDKVGVYCAESTGGNVNIPYTASSTAFSSTFSGNMKWGTGTHNFYAYYPYSATAGTDATLIPITLATGQTQSASGSSSHIGDLDFLVSTPVSKAAGVEGASTTVDLLYNHVFTVLEFQIKGSGTLKAVKLLGSNTLAFSGGTIDITQAAPATGVAYTIAGQTGTSTQAVVTLTTPATLTATNADTKVYMVINPGTPTGNCVIGLSTDGTTWKYITKTAPAGGFLRGNKYVVSVDAATAADPVDGDANTYSTVLIGTQVWMASNLKTTKYNDGTDIQNVTVDATWAGLTTGAYCWYNNDAATYKAIYGALYNWYAVDNNGSTKVASNGGKNICPLGWHVPTSAEWTTLTEYLGGESIAGAKLKEAGSTHWAPVNTATNSSSFTALPGGYRSNDGSLSSDGYQGRWWSSTEYTTGLAWYRYMLYDRSDAFSDKEGKAYGFSVRCLRD